MNTSTLSISAALAICGSAALAQHCGFGDPITYPLVDLGRPSQSTYIVAGDLDNDGDFDLVTDSNGPGNDPTHVLWNDGSGQFTIGPVLASGWGSGEVDVGDMDGDGDLDVIRANRNSNGVYFFRNNGDQTFASGIYYAGGGGCVAVKFLDFDNDGDLDFVTVDSFGSKIRPYRNINGLGFTSVGLFQAGSNPFALDSADLDNDGDIDIVVTNEDTSSITACYNNGSGSYTTRQSFAVGDRPTDVILHDLNSDGFPDAVVTDWDAEVGFGNTVSVLLGDGMGSFEPRVTYTTSVGPRGVRAADMNSDGLTDLVVSGELSGTFALLAGNGDGTFADAQIVDTGIGPSMLTLADFDADGDPDIAYIADDFSQLITVSNECGSPVDPPALQMEWEVGFDNLLNVDAGTHVVVAHNGDLIVAGRTARAANEDDFLLARFDAQGEFVWKYTYNGDGDHYDTTSFLGLDDQGNIFIAGESWGTGNSKQWAVAKVAPDGTELWVNRYDGGNPISQQDLRGYAIGPNGEFAMCGQVWDAAFTGLYFDAVCYDSAGTEQWTVRFPQGSSNSGTRGNAITFDDSGNVLTTGSVPDDDESGTEMFIAKIAPDGVVIWSDQPDPTTDTIRNITSGKAITTDSMGNVFVGAEVSLNGVAGNDAAIVRYGPDGVLVDLSLDSQDGSVTPTHFLWMGPDALLLTGSAGSGMVFATRYDPAGIIDWSVTLEGNTGSVGGGSHVAIGADERLYFIDTDGGDVVVEQRSHAGEQLSRTRIDTGSSTDQPNAIAAGSGGVGGGHLYVVGQFDAEIVNQRDVLILDLVINDLCAADLNGDGSLNFLDVSGFLNAFGVMDPAVDFTNDGALNFLDVSAFLEAFAMGCP